MAPPEEPPVAKTLLGKLLGPNPAVDVLQKVAAIAAAIGTAWQAINKDKVGASIAAVVLVISALWFFGARRWRRRHPVRVAVTDLPPGSKAYLRGLLPFERGDSLLGRRSDLDLVLAIVDRDEFRFGFLSGEAGAGKTSFLRAALLPKLEDAGWSVVYVPRLSTDPSEAVRREFRRRIPNTETANRSVELARILAKTTNKRIALVCDQFEQFFLAYPTVESRAPFLEELSAFCNDDALRGALLLSLRKEFVDDLQDFEPQISDLIDRRNKHRLRNWDTRTAIDVLKIGAKHDGVPFADALIEVIVADLAQEGVVRPVELQVVATRLHEQGVYEMSRYIESGRARGVLANYIREFIEPQGDKTPELQRQAARHLLRALCLSDHDVRRPGGVAVIELIADVRESMIRSEQQALIADSPALERTIQSLIRSGLDEYLLIMEDEERLNLTHDYIVAPIRDATADVSSLEEQADRLLNQHLELARVRASRVIPWKQLQFIRHHASSSRLTNPSAAPLVRRSRRRFIVKSSVRVGIMLLLATLLLLWGIFRDVAPPYNQPLAAASAKTLQPENDLALTGIWPNHPDQDDSTLMLAAISGGGTRAAAVGWKALEVLRRVPYRFTNAQGQLIDSDLAREIDLAVGNSGGSFAATAWCLSHEDMTQFQKRFVERDIQHALASELVTRKGLSAMFSRRYERVSFVAELYDRDVFDGKTFGDLPDRPLLRVQATDIALGRHFTFTQGTFARLGSNLDSYPLGFACAASSAFPILLTPLTLRNYGPPLDLSKDVEYILGKDNARNDLNADLKTKAWEYYNDKSNEYVHLADGGLVDNQGLQSILDEFDTNGIINRRLNHASPPLKRLIIVNVNAGVTSENETGHSPSAPSVASVIQSTMVSSMDVLSARRWMDIQAKCIEIYKAHIDVGATTTSLSRLEEPYRIEVSFRNIRDPELRRQAMALPTSFKLTPEQLALIDKVGRSW